MAAASDVERALAIYVALGKRRSIYGAWSRGMLQLGCKRRCGGEAVHLPAQGAATAAYIDTAISQGLGLRWALVSRT